MGSHTPKKSLVTERDVDLLLSLYKYRYLTSSQVRRLHFPSQQTANRRIRALEVALYVGAAFVPGLEERLLCLRRKGADVVAERLRVVPEKLGWKKNLGMPKDPYFVRHFAAVNDFRIALTTACEARDDLLLLGFIPESEGVRTPKGMVRKYLRDVVSDVRSPNDTITHTPDGVFALQKNGKSALFFLEIDRGTETITDGEKGFLKTIRFYLHYLLRGGFERYGADFSVTDPFRVFRVLVVTTSLRRLENIRAAGGALVFEPEKAKRLIWVTAEAAVACGNVLSNVWASLDPRDDRSYAIVP
jgi:hypothetical protein